MLLSVQSHLQPVKSLSSLIILLFFVSLSNSSAQTSISGINASYEVTETDTSYQAGGNTYTFGVEPSAGTGNDLILESFVINVGDGNEVFDTIRLADRINIVRIDNDNVSGNKQLLFFEAAGTTILCVQDT